MLPSKKHEKKCDRQSVDVSAEHKDHQLSFTPVTDMRTGQGPNVDYIGLLRHAAQLLQRAVDNVNIQDCLCLVRGTIVWYVCSCVSRKRGWSGGTGRRKRDKHMPCASSPRFLLVFCGEGEQACLPQMNE